MATDWIPGAERLGDGSIGGAMDTPELPGRVVWHTTESGTGNAAFDAVASYLIRESYEPQVIYDPTTDRIGQFGPLSQSARALQNDGSTRTNRTGRVCIQIEVLGHATAPFTDTWNPGPNFRALMDAIRSWGIPDVFPLPLAPDAEHCTRVRDTWEYHGGHYGHCNVPGNSHWDPGEIDTAKLLAKDDDVPTVDEIVDGIFKADRIPASRVLPNSDFDTNKTWTFQYAMQTAVESARSAQAAAEAAQKAAEACLAKMSVGLTTDQIAAAGKAGAAEALTELGARLQSNT